MLADALNKIGRFGEADVALLESRMVHRQYKKNELLINEGEVCRTVRLLLTGAAYQFSILDIDENVIDMYIPGDWVLNYTSFVGQKPATSRIKVFADCEVLEISIHTVHELIGSAPVFFQLGIILEQALARMHYFDNSFTPLQKYNYLLDTRPRLLQDFPLKMIASYLKITPETLSRVRAAY